MSKLPEAKIKGSNIKLNKAKHKINGMLSRSKKFLKNDWPFLLAALIVGGLFSYCTHCSSEMSKRHSKESDEQVNLLKEKGKKYFSFDKGYTTIDCSSLNPQVSGCIAEPVNATVFCTGYKEGTLPLTVACETGEPCILYVKRVKE